MRINALIQLKQPRLRHWNIKQNCLLIIRGTEDFIKRLVCFVALLIEELPAHLMLSGQMANRSALDRTSIAKLFREAGVRLAATDGVDSFFRAGWKIRHQITSISDQCHSPQISLLVAFPQQFSVLPAFEPPKTPYTRWEVGILPSLSRHPRTSAS